MMEAIASPFTELVKTLKLQPPQIPYVSNVTGTWITSAQATDPNYWTKHLCQPVRFADGVNNLWEQQHPILLEVGPGQTLSSLALQCLHKDVADQVVLPSLRHAYERQSDVAFLLNTLGQLWLSGVQIDWPGFYAHERRRRLPLPTYPFERERYWIDPPQSLQFKPTPSNIWQSLVYAGQNQANTGKSAFDEQTYQEQKLWMDRLCTAYINQTLRDLGAFYDSSEKYSFEELFQKCQIIPHYQQLWWRWLQILVEQGHLQQDEEGVFTNLLPLSTESVHALLAEVRLKWSETPETVDILEYCGKNLTSVLTGKKQALEFHVAKFAEEDEVPIQNLPSVGYYKAIMQATLERLVKSLPADVNLRILEIGGGQGIATEDMLAVLPPERTKYLFTDVGGWFLNTAEKKYKNYPFVEYGFLDIERPLTDQGYSEHSFDVVIAVNVLHVVRNIGEALENVRSLLAPGGLLLMWEITQPQLLFDVADGLLMNPVEDAGRNQGNPFLSQEQWEKALRSHGFSEVAAFSEIDDFGQHVLLAQASPTVTPAISAAFTGKNQQKNIDQTLQVSFGKKPDITDWFYIPSWKRSMLGSPNSQGDLSGCYLVFLDECGLGSQIAQRLQLAGKQVVTVKIGEQFASESNLYTINPRQPNDYNRLLKELRALQFTPKQIIHCWSVTSSTVDETEKLGFHSLLFLAQALGEQNLTESIEIGIVSNNMQAVTGSEELCPEKALILGPCKVIPLEYSNIKCRSIDVVIPDPNSWRAQELVDQLLMEFTTQTSDQIIAYRGVHRWVQTFEPVRLEKTLEEKPCLREEGVYLITGGLGGVGLTLAEYLARSVKAKLILTGRSAFPAKQEWSQWLSTHDQQDNISLKIQKIRELETLGAEVLVVSADVTDSQQMSEAIAQANQQFGQIHGVIHAAFIPRGCMIQRMTKETPSADVGPKVKGTQVLATLFQNIKLDFFLLFSSIYAFEPLAGQVDYVAESAFLDAFAYYSISKKYPTFIRSINWDGWSGVGAAVSFTAKYKEITGKDIRDGMTASEGIEAFKRILKNSRVPQIVVSTHDLLTLLTQVEQNLSLEALQKADISKPIRQRPELKNAYVAPSNELECKIAESFQKFLGFEQVGIHDNFFALGGDSLTGSVLIKQLGENFQIELPLRLLYEAPTIAELAVVIEKILIEELQELTEEEANLILGQNN
jgi:NADP-dependent 3-hydroxy acid dehydrogenase YdfG/ubiquinone/menaquinone biosynthesis C-methylase UbiE/acyl carrier protein